MKSEYSFLVSVRLMTYNHEPFISKAMDSILMQKTNFPIEIVVGDDFSTDQTLSILKEYKDTSYVQINILNRKINDEYWKKRQELGRIYNFVNILQNCKGKYIALLDGDDYWTDEKKLQDQITFLESHEDFVMCFNNVCLADLNDRIVKKVLLNYSKDEFDHEELVTKISPPTLTTVFRKNALPQIFPDSFFKVANADMFLKALVSLNGKTKFINKVTAIKCLHSGGVNAGKSFLKREEMKLLTYSLMLSHFESIIVRKNLKKAMGRSYLRLLYHYALRREFKNFSRICKSFFDFSITNRLFPPVWLIFSKVKRN
jgi:glycosyltransferase involved in cell wall biosynthesis